jgi:hypothetical protein
VVRQTADVPPCLRDGRWFLERSEEPEMTFPVAEYYLRSHAEATACTHGSKTVWKPVRRRRRLR